MVCKIGITFACITLSRGKQCNSVQQSMNLAVSKPCMQPFHVMAILIYLVLHTMNILAAPNKAVPASYPQTV